MENLLFLTPSWCIGTFVKTSGLDYNFPLMTNTLLSCAAMLRADTRAPRRLRRARRPQRAPSPPAYTAATPITLETPIWNYNGSPSN